VCIAQLNIKSEFIGTISYETS